MGMIPFQFEPTLQGPSRVLQNPRNQEMVNAALQEAKAIGAGKDVVDQLLGAAVAEEQRQIDTTIKADATAYNTFLKYSQKQLYQDLDELADDRDPQELYDKYLERNSQWLEQPGNVKAKAGLEALTQSKGEVEYSTRLEYLLRLQKRDADINDSRFRTGIDLAVELGDVEGLEANIGGLVQNESISEDEGKLLYLTEGRKLEQGQNKKTIEVAQGLIAGGDREGARALMEESLSYAFTAENEKEQRALMDKEISDVLEVGELARLRNYSDSLLTAPDGLEQLTKFKADVESGKEAKDLVNKGPLISTINADIKKLETQSRATLKELASRTFKAEIVDAEEIESIQDKELREAFRGMYEAGAGTARVGSREDKRIEELLAEGIGITTGFIEKEVSKGKLIEFFNEVNNSNLDAEGKAYYYQEAITYFSEGLQKFGNEELDPTTKKERSIGEIEIQAREAAGAAIFGTLDIQRGQALPVLTPVEAGNLYIEVDDMLRNIYKADENYPLDQANEKVKELIRQKKESSYRAIIEQAVRSGTANTGAVERPIPITSKEEFEALPTGTRFIYNNQIGIKK